MRKHRSIIRLRKATVILLIFTCLLTSLFPERVAAKKTEQEKNGLVLYYDFSQTESLLTGILDMSGNDNTGFIKRVGGESPKEKYKIVNADIYGTTVKALSLPGGADGTYLQLPSGFIDGKEAVTVSMWVRLAGDASYQRIWDFGSNTEKYIYLLSDGKNAGHEGYAAAITEKGWKNETGVNKKSDIVKNTWVFTTVVLDKTTMSVYENGKQTGKSVDTGISIRDLGKMTNNCIGYGQFKDTPTEAEFAEIKIYDKALTAEQIQTMYETFHTQGNGHSNSLREEDQSDKVKTVEEIKVTTQEGVSPCLPNNVTVTYQDGSSEKVKAVWPVKIEEGSYAKTGSFTVNGSLTGFDIPVIAEVTVVEETGESIKQTAENFPLEDITLDKTGANGSILTQNRDREIDYLKQLDKDRMLYNFYKNYGETDKLKGLDPLAGWDEPDGLLRGHSTGRYMSALALAYSTDGDESLKADLDHVVHELRRMQEKSSGDPAEFKAKGTNQGVWSKNPGKWGEGYIGAFPPDQFSLLEEYTEYGKIWAPYYTLHKLLAGFLDAYTYTGNEEALEAAKDLGRWVCRRLGACSREQLAKMWEMYVAGEFGGCNESLAQLYLYTGDTAYLDGAKLFDNVSFFDNLEKNIDDIAGRHTNQHISQVIGAVKVYEATVKAAMPQESYYRLADNFWKMVVSRYAYSTGGVGTGEKFTQPYQQADNISGVTNCDTCASYNMLRLTKALNVYQPDNAEYMDYYERTLYNHMLAAQTPNVTADMSAGTAARVPVGNGVVRTYSENYTSFTCCHGTGMESPFRYQEAAYVKTEDTLYVGLYLPSTVTWKEKGIAIKQETKYPSENTKFRVSALAGEKSMPVNVKLRVPYWATAGFTVKVNGAVKITDPDVSTYVELTDIKEGDVIEVYMPWTLHLDQTPDTLNNAMIASVMYGPFVMAAQVNSEDWKTLVLSDDLTKSFTVSKDEETGFPVLTAQRYSFAPMFSPQYAVKPYDTYFKILYTDDAESRWYEVTVRNDTPKDGTFYTDADMVKEGDALVITAVPEDGYVVRTLEVNGSQVEMDSDNTYTVQNVRKNIEITGNFRLANANKTDEEHLEYSALVTSDFTSNWEDLEGIMRDWEPDRSAAGIGKGWGNWPQQGGSEHYVQYEWEEAVTMDRFDIYWYDDGGDTAIPASIQIVYKDADGRWKDALMLSDYKDVIEKDTYNTIRIRPLTTTIVKLILTVQEDKAATGILRWKVSNENIKDTDQVKPADVNERGWLYRIWNGLVQNIKNIIFHKKA